ncbi:MAG: arylesterase [Cyclobacteriaceae bacterium]|nr:arylesterase [Cyclobacteriaceae bacterium]MCX7637205.1 arylesterase [Cyclobacteriaceae bacterium]MDW8331429.1 arylesterase [Cyclobacteriaceae bacterium]
MVKLFRTFLHSNMIYTWFTISALLLLATQVVAQKTILFFGNSLTAGYGLTPDEAFPTITGELLKKKGKTVRVINGGLSGETSAGGLARIDWMLREKVDIFVLELGANDGLRGLPLEQTRSNLQGIINKVRAKNPKVKIVIAGMMVPPNMGPDYSTKFQQLFKELAQQNHAVLIPFLLDGVAGHAHLNLEDGIHPNKAGHQIVAQTVLKYIEPLL